MTDAEERRLRPEHHVVHDYANLVSSWRLREEPYIAALEQIPTANSQSSHVFLMNCRKMFEFFKYAPDKDGVYLRAAQFVEVNVAFEFQHWNHTVQEFMNAHLLHVGASRVTNKKESTGSDDELYFADFHNAWRTMLQNLKSEHRDVFRDEIDARLSSEDAGFRILCGTLDKEMIP